MFKFKVTLVVSSEDEARVDKLFESLLTEQLSKRAERDFLISFNENELKIELCDVEFTEKLASKIIGCGTVKKFIMENQAEPKNKPEKEIESKVKVTENEQVTSSETEAETDSENEKEENESDSEDDTDANAEAGVEETESEPEPEKVPKAEAEEETKPEPEPEEIPKAKAEEESKPEPESKATSEVKAKEKLAEETSLEEFSKEYAEKLYEESENLEEFSRKLVDYIQISESRIRNAFEELVKAVDETKKMSWFCIENIIKHSSQNLYRKTEFNTNTKVLISKAVKERFNLTLLVFLKLIKELMIEVNSKTKENSEPEPESEEIPEAKAEAEPEPEPEPEVVPEAKSEEEHESKLESEEVPEAKVEEEPEPEQEESFDEYWSGIFKCMPKIISTDTSRIQKVCKKEKQFLAIDKSKPISSRIKEVLEIMEEINLINDETFLSLAEKFIEIPEIKIEKSTPLYQKMRLLQWSKSLNKFVQKYYTDDPNFRVRIENFLAELREIIL